MPKTLVKNITRTEISFRWVAALLSRQLRALAVSVTQADDTAMEKERTRGVFVLGIGKDERRKDLASL